MGQSIVRMKGLVKLVKIWGVSCLYVFNLGGVEGRWRGGRCYLGRMVVYRVDIVCGNQGLGNNMA